MTTTAPTRTVLCGHCWEPTADATACAHCGQPVLLRSPTDSYRLERRLGEGASGVTFDAVRLIDGQRVCIKALSFRGMTSFEAERIFKRETNILRQLRHRQIPSYFDDFTAGSGRNFALYLVQELIDGVDLATEVSNRRPTTDQVLTTLDELLSVLEHLHSLAPPVVHRDIKPKNIMRRRDGQLVLIDFGAVKDAVHASFDPGMSLVGTVGYMAPEQLRGQASPASDLYAVGMVGVFLLSGQEPASLIDERHEVQWERALSAPEPIVAWLRQMTAPVISERPSSAREARRLLTQARKPQAIVASIVSPVGAPSQPRDEPTVTPTTTPHARLKQTFGPASQRSSKANLGVVGSAMCGVFKLLGVAMGGAFSLLQAAGMVIAAIGWFGLSKQGHRSARFASIGLAIHAGSWLLTFVGFWQVAILASGFGQIMHFVAAGLFGARSIRERRRHAKGLRVATGLHFVGAALALCAQLSYLDVLSLDYDLWTFWALFFAVTHLSAVVFFLPSTNDSQVATRNSSPA